MVSYDVSLQAGELLMVKEPKVKWVKSWREIPGATSNVHGHVTSKGTIYAIKGETSKADVEHEKGHIALGHLKKKRALTASAHVREEIDATYYSYKRIGQPNRILSRLRALYNDLAFREYGGQYKEPRQILKVIRDALKRHPIPIAWKRDYARLVEEARGDVNY